MPSALSRLSPLRKALLAAAAFLGVAIFSMLFAPVPIASAASNILAPGAYLARAVGLGPGFVTLLVAYYLDFALYTSVFAPLLALVDRQRRSRT